MTSRPRVLSLFSGVGGFDLGLEAAGMQTAALCEIDPKCRQVLRRHWPDIPIYEDVSTVTARQLLADGVEPDIIAFGSPCQDLSVAGRRAGLAGSRSGLFGEAVRIIRELREETGGRLPAFAIWENVVGALSSTQGDDFAAVLDSLADAGAMVLEWGVLDAQHYGVPQRRRRIFLVACFDPAAAERCPDPLLPLRQGRPGDLAKSRTARKDPPADLAACLRSGGDGGVPSSRGEHLVAQERPGVMAIDATRVDDTRIYDDVVPTLKARMGTGGNQVPLVADDAPVTNDQYLFQPEPPCQVCGQAVAWCSCQRCMTCETLVPDSVEMSADDDGELICPTCETGGPAYGFDSTFSWQSRVHIDQAPPLKVGSGLGIASPPAVGQPIPIQDGRGMEKQQNGLGIAAEGDPAYTLDTTGGQAVAQPIAFATNQRSEVRDLGDTAMTLNAERGTNQQNYVAQPIAIQGTIIGRSDTAGPQGKGIGEEGGPMYTLDTVSQHGVAQPLVYDGYNQSLDDSGVHRTLRIGRDSSDFVAQPIDPEVYVKVVRPQSAEHPEIWRSEPVSPTLNSFDIGDGRTASIVVDPVEPTVVSPPLTATNDPFRSPQSSEVTAQVSAVYQASMLVRRLTPVECERLMGWPDDHTRWTADGTEVSDTHRYKMCGNGVASPVSEWVGRQIMGIWQD